MSRSARTRGTSVFATKTVSSVRSPRSFQSLDGKNRLTRRLKVRHFFEPGTSMIARDIAEPGALTQSLCAPWQNDYRECACFYWAANRPDFVNVEVGTNGSSAGHNWMQKDRTSSTALDPFVPTSTFTKS